MHCRVVAELLHGAGVVEDYAALDEAARVALLRRELASTAAAGQSLCAVQRRRRCSELEIVRAAATAHALYGSACITAYIISKCESVSDMLEVNLMLKEAGLYRPAAPEEAAIMVVPLFETIGDLERAPQIMREWLALPEVRAAAARRGCQEVMVGLFGLEQGRRLPHVGVEPEPRHARAGRRVRRGWACACRSSTAVAGPWVAAAARRSRPSARSRRAPCRDGCASPSRAR